MEEPKTFEKIKTTNSTEFNQFINSPNISADINMNLNLDVSGIAFELSNKTLIFGIEEEGSKKEINISKGDEYLIVQYGEIILQSTPGAYIIPGTGISIYVHSDLSFEFMNAVINNKDYQVNPR